jgi:hypothetical protein
VSQAKPREISSLKRTPQDIAGPALNLSHGGCVQRYAEGNSRPVGLVNWRNQDELHHFNPVLGRGACCGISFLQRGSGMRASGTRPMLHRRSIRGTWSDLSHHPLHGHGTLPLGEYREELRFHDQTHSHSVAAARAAALRTRLSTVLEISARPTQSGADLCSLWRLLRYPGLVFRSYASVE